ncbi:MAG TPA: type IV secretory system conjugative DNA transfer family protein [Acidimicrobiales bacterium]|jgi:type IV secretion system protein VirD4|nr:type IV secretory system conjugative DNA transfer family protein [Acidimicrobiales bacterium]
MTSVTAAVLPVALGGALFAAVSMRPSIDSLGRIGRRRQRGAHWADRRDLRPLLVAPRQPYPGRLVLGTSPSKVHTSLVVAEAQQSVVVVGPTQSGKTTALAVPAILNWQGPVVAASVKSDLLQHTLGRRTAMGRVWCIDPTGATGARPSTWSPLAACIQWPAALRMASDLAETAKGDGVLTDGEFWYANASKLLAPLLFAAAHDGRSMADVLRWVDTQEAAEVSVILEQIGQEDALIAARATWCRDDRTRSSVYTTAETILAPFAGMRDSSSGRFEPWDLLGAANTLYLCAPAHDQRRLRGFFSALTQQVLSHAFAQATLRGKPLDPPLLVVLDEAAHIAPLPELDGLAATSASHGIQLVTVWQDLAQVRSRYGAKAPTVLNNHRAKIFLPGIADPDTLDYVSRLVGDEEIALPSVTRDPHGGRSTTSTTSPRRLLPPEELRCLNRSQAVLVYGTLPPARVRLRPWWEAPLPGHPA